MERGGAALITGAAARIGAATAAALCKWGYRVVIHCHRSLQKANALALQLKRAGGEAFVLQADLSSPEAAEDLFGRAVKIAGPIDLLINNASAFETGQLLSCTPEDLRRNEQLHAISPLQLSRALYAQSRPGVIINLLDTRVHDYDREHAAYHLSKRSLLSLTKLLALELAPHVRVNAVAPGLILPPAGEGMDYLEKRHSSNPLLTHGSCDDVVEAVLFLVRSPFITGEVIHVDGGRHLRGNTGG